MVGYIYDGPRFTRSRNRTRGRPPSGQARMLITSITIPKAQYEWLIAFGGDNLSKGVRKAVAIAMQEAAKAAPSCEPGYPDEVIAPAPGQDDGTTADTFD